MTYLPSLLSDTEMSSEVPGTIACGTDQKHSNKTTSNSLLGKGPSGPYIIWPHNWQLLEIKPQLMKVSSNSLLPLQEGTGISVPGGDGDGCTEPESQKAAGPHQDGMGLGFSVP